MEVAAMEELTQSPTRHGPDPDLDLVAASTRGDIAAFEELVRRYDRKLLRIAHQVTHDWEDAQDAIQETFLKAYQKLNQFRGTSKFSTWLIRIALNESLMKVRKRRSAPEVPLEYEDRNGENAPLDVADWSPNAEQIYSRAELQEILRKAIRGAGPDSPSSLRPPRRRGPIHQGNNGNTGPTTKCSEGAPPSCSAAASRELKQVFSTAIAPSAKLSPTRRGHQGAMTSISETRVTAS